MAKIELTLTGAWDSYQRAIDPKAFNERLAKKLTIAHSRVGQQFQAVAKRAIRQGKYAPNSPLTIILKGSSKPLVDGGDLFQGITHYSPSPWELRVGLVRGRSGVNDEQVNIALILHEGATIDVGAHPKVRPKVWGMVTQVLKATGGLSKNSKASVLGAAAGLSSGGSGGAKDLWAIPARPFIMEPLASASFKAFIRKAYFAAVSSAFRGPPIKNKTEKP